MTRLVCLAIIVVSFTACSGNSGGDGRNAEFYYSLAVNYLYEKNAQAALLELEQCFKLDPNHVPGHNLAGLIYLGRLDYAQALVHLQKAVALDPECHDCRANLGATLLAMRDWQGAVDTLTPLLTEPRYATPYLAENNLGWAYFNLGRLNDAEAHLQRALFLNNEMCLAYNNIGLVHIEQKRHEDALDDFEASIKRCPEYVDPWFHSATLYEAAGNIGEAGRRYQKCSKLGGDGVFGRRCKKKMQVIR